MSDDRSLGSHRPHPGADVHPAWVDADTSDIHCMDPDLLED